MKMLDLDLSLRRRRCVDRQLVVVILLLVCMDVTGCGGSAAESHHMTSGRQIIVVESLHAALAKRTVSRMIGSGCIVPSLTRQPLRVARRALREAHCRLGKVTLFGEPSAFYKEGSSYIVTEQSVSTGTTLPVNSAVAVQLGPAPAGLVSYRVPSGSMEPSFPVGTTVWVQTRGYSPAVGDVVVFHPPEDAQREECGPVPHTVKLGSAACAEPGPKEASVKFLKRIVAAPGEEMYVKEGHVYRTTKRGSDIFFRDSDPYIKPCGSSPECNFPTPIKIPAGHWFMMGDNRGESDDSRFWGPVPTSWIVGHVVYCTAVGVHCPGT